MTFLIPYRGRPKIKEDLIIHLKYYYPESPIVFIEQLDDKDFMKGQLFNIGFKFVKDDLLILLDLDIRLNYFDFPKAMAKIKKPIIPFNTLNRVVIIAPNEYKVVKIGLTRYDIGGVACLTREQFVKYNGYSNLFFGYGFEDHLLNNRVKLNRINNTILHVEHETQDKNSGLFANNKWLADSDHLRDSSEDGYTQTTCSIRSLTQRNNILDIKCNKISVAPEFKYMELLSKGLSLCKN